MGEIALKVLSFGAAASSEMAYRGTGQGRFASRRIVRLYTALSRVLQVSIALHRSRDLCAAAIQPEFRRYCTKSVCLDAFFSNAAVQAATERGLSEVACAPVQSKMVHKGPMAMRRSFMNPSIMP